MNQERLNELKKELMNMLFIALSKLTDKQARENVKQTSVDLLAIIDAEIARQSDPGSQSDGYHTFDDLYDQRAVLFAALCRAYPDKAWRSKLHHDGTMFDSGYFIVGIETIKGQYTYHYKLNRWDLYDCCKTLDRAPEWDGHNDKDVERLLFLPDEEPRQSVTDEDVQRAIEDACYKKLEIAVGYAEAVENSEDYRTALNMLYEAALSAFRKPALPVQQIINALQTILDEKLTMGPNDINTLICHLQNCTSERKPTAEEVESIDMAIDEIIGTNYGECQMHRDTLETAITALRRMKGSERG